MQMTALGNQGLVVARQGLGCMGRPTRTTLTFQGACAGKASL